MKFSLYIAKRYLLSKSSNNAINFITVIAAVGVVLGAMSLFIVLSGFAGLKDFTLQFTSIIDPDLKAEAAFGKSFYITEEDYNALNAEDNIIAFSKVIEERVIVSFEDKNYPAFIKGVDENYQIVNTIESVIAEGSWLSQNTNQIVAGWGISNNLSFNVLDYGKRVGLRVPKPGKGQITSVKQAFISENTINVGVFDVNEALNDTYVYASFALAKNLVDLKDNEVTSIEFKIKEGEDLDVIKERLQVILGEKVVIKNRAQLNDALYKMLNTENLAVYLIFTLVLIIALFNVIGSIIMMILDKKKTLNTLYSLGATMKDIRKIFFYQGSLMSIVGGLIGLGLGFLLVINQLYGPDVLKVMITPYLAYPVAIKIENFLIVFITISILGVIASKIASSRITKRLVEHS